MQPESAGSGARVDEARTVQAIRDRLLHRHPMEPPSHTSPGGSFFAADVAELVSLGVLAAPADAEGAGREASFAVIPIDIDPRDRAVLRLSSAHVGAFSPESIETVESVARTLGLAIADRRAQAALRERVKELSCLYSILQIRQREEQPLDVRLLEIARLLPEAWQYPEIAVARVVLDGREFSTGVLDDALHAQRSQIAVNRHSRGFVEVGYLQDSPELIEGPFLPEEQSLLDAIAHEIALFVERVESKEQLRHADRLTTIGHLAAGIAHEVNEPLGAILGFAQLIEKSPALPDELGRDVARIISASLSAREIIRNLMLFARQGSPVRQCVHLREVVLDTMSLLEPRCQRASVRVRLELAEDLPAIHGDRVQLQQVVTNLVVNALQAMPDGGALTISTSCTEDGVALSVRDTGEGIRDDMRDRIFDPFFTTRDIGQGTGLGLSLVHGIVMAHGGSIEVESSVGKGTTLTILLPRSTSSSGSASDE
jgi:signal transduction histidine kinase